MKSIEELREWKKERKKQEKKYSLGLENPSGQTIKKLNQILIVNRQRR